MIFYNFIASVNSDKDFTDGWTRFKDTVTLEDLVIPLRDGENKGKYGLWWLAKVADLKPALFEAVMKKHKASLKLENLLGKAQTEGTSALWLLAWAATKGNAALFKRVIEKFKRNLTIDHLLVEIQQGGSALLSLVSNCTHTTEIINIIMNQLPGIIPQPIIAKLIEAGVSPVLISTRNTFFTRLSEAKQQDQLSEEEIKLLSALAKAAQAAGYINANHDLGTLLIAYYDKNFGAVPVFLTAYPHAQSAIKRPEVKDPRSVSREPSPIF